MGLDVGGVLGDEVGRKLGEADVGYWGFSEGYAELTGFCVGTKVGFEDTVGDAEGVLVGVLDGAAVVGLNVGATVGTKDG